MGLMVIALTCMPLRSGPYAVYLGNVRGCLGGKLRLSRSCILSRLATDSRLPDLTMKCSMDGEVVNFVDSAASALPALPAFIIDPAKHMRVAAGVGVSSLAQGLLEVLHTQQHGLHKIVMIDRQHHDHWQHLSHPSVGLAANGK